MRAVVQRVKQAAVTIDGNQRREIGSGLVILVAVAPDDMESDAEYIAEKCSGLRIFSDAMGKMNRSVREVEHASCLVISQFTLFGDARRGKRPSFIAAAPPEIAIPLYNRFVEMLRNSHNLTIKTGEFGADMLLEIHNDGPVTILLDSKRLF